MGKYDGGMYETYIIGRTHITGETLTANLTNLDNAGNWAISLEEGFGAKYDIMPFLNNQCYQIFTNKPGRQQRRRALPRPIATPSTSPTRARCRRARRS